MNQKIYSQYIYIYYGSCYVCKKGRKEGNVLFNDALNTFYLWLYGIRHMVKDHSDSEETRCRHMGYSFRLTARVLLYAPSHRQDNTYHSLCYTSCGALAGMRNSSMGPPHEGSLLLTKKEGRKEIFNAALSTFFYSYMALNHSGS